MRLWTFQPLSVSQVLNCDQPFVATWDKVSDGYHNAYRWMLERLSEKTGVTLHAPPIWCWQSCDKFGRGPTVETAESLLSEAERGQNMIVIELDVPQEMMLLSSYANWNDFLDSSLSGSRSSDAYHVDRWQQMFMPPLLKHEYDLVQAVVPYIDNKWVTSIRRLALIGRGPDELV